MKPQYVCPACARKYFDPPYRCADCDTEMGWKCSSCQHGNPLIYKRCGQCGTAIPSVVAAKINEGKQLRIINIPQYSEQDINELLEEGAGLTARKKIKTLSQTDLDKLFG